MQTTGERSNRLLSDFEIMAGRLCSADKLASDPRDLKKLTEFRRSLKRISQIPITHPTQSRWNLAGFSVSLHGPMVAPPLRYIGGRRRLEA